MRILKLITANGTVDFVRLDLPDVRYVELDELTEAEYRAIPVASRRSRLTYGELVDACITKLNSERNPSTCDPAK